MGVRPTNLFVLVNLSFLEAIVPVPVPPNGPWNFAILDSICNPTRLDYQSDALIFKKDNEVLESVDYDSIQCSSVRQRR